MTALDFLLGNLMISIHVCALARKCTNLGRPLESGKKRNLVFFLVAICFLEAVSSRYTPVVARFSIKKLRDEGTRPQGDDEASPPPRRTWERKLLRAGMSHCEVLCVIAVLERLTILGHAKLQRMIKIPSIK